MVFHFRYASFLKIVVNNDYEAQKVFDKAASIYSVLINQRQKAGVSENNASEKIIFGENTAAAIIILSLKGEDVGRIQHTNNEVYRLIGYRRNELVGKKINKI